MRIGDCSQFADGVGCPAEGPTGEEGVGVMNQNSQEETQLVNRHLGQFLTALGGHEHNYNNYMPSDPSS